MSDKQKLIEARLARIAEECGGNLTPDAVVEDARHKKSPLHEFFDWDDSEAAHKWRIEQARSLIRSVRVEIVTEEKTVSTVRYLRNPEAGKGQGYVDVAVLRESTDLARRALRAEFARAKALFDRAEGLAEAFDMRNEIVELRERVVEMDERLQRAPQEAAAA